MPYERFGVAPGYNGVTTFSFHAGADRAAANGTIWAVDDELVDHGNGLFQNKRCGSVFKDPRFHDGKLAYDIDAAEPRAAVSFPYWPDRAAPIG